MFSVKPKRSLFSKVVSLFLVCAFAFYNVSFAATDADIGTPPVVEEVKGPLSVDDIGVAIDCATVKSKFTGGTDKVIVHIQDAHCNYEAQSNINKVLEQLTKECGIDMISVEGAEGLVDTTWFRAFPDSEIRKEVANYFMKKGEITGAEFFSITSEYKGTIFGAETRDYYVKNLRAFTEVYPYKDAIEKYFTDMRVVANRLKSIVYPAKLRDLDLKIREFDAKEIELSAYAGYLARSASRYKVSLESYPNFKRLLETLEYEEKIDFDIVDQERSEYIDVLSKKLSKEDMTELVTRSIRFKKGHIKAVDFYGYLRDLAKEHDIPIVREFQNLFYYYLYTKLYDGIDNEKLFKEIDALETALKDRLFTDGTQRKLDKFSTMIEMFIDLVNIELTNEDYDLFKEYTDEYSMEQVLDFLGGLNSRYNLNYDIGVMPLQVSENIPGMISFYEIAIKRDTALIDNTLEQMKDQGTDRCVLIAGGFHTRGIKNILEEKGVSYMVVTPKITKDVETPYIKVLTNQRTSLEDIITESAAVPGVGITATREEIVRPKGDMLAPLNKVFYTIPLYVERPEDLNLLSEAIGAVEGRTLIEATGEAYKDMVAALVRGWLMKVKAEVQDPAVWNEAVQNWPLLLGAYLRAYEKEAMRAGIQLAAGYRSSLVMTEEELATINEEFRGIFRGVVAEETTDEAEAVRVGITDTSDLYEPLSEAQHKGLNMIIDRLRREGKYGLEEFRVRVKNEATGKLETKTVNLYTLEGLKDSIEEYNRNPVHGEAIPLDVEVHPTQHPHEYGYNAYISDTGRAAITKAMARRIARHELYHMLNPGVGEKKACEAVGDRTDLYLADIRGRLDKAEKARAEDKQAREEAALIAANPGLAGNKANVDWTHELAENNDSARIVAVVSGSQVHKEGWEEMLETANADLFNKDGSTLVLSLQEKIGDKDREGNMLGTLLAYRNIREKALEAGINYRDWVTLLGMVFGQGERMQPGTGAKAGMKPGIEVTPSVAEIGGIRRGYKAIEEALVYFTPVAKFLEKCGFRGILDKWGDETELASIDLKKLAESGMDLSDRDVMKVISVLNVADIPDDKAKEKDWVVFDTEGRMLAQLSRNEAGADALREDIKAKVEELRAEGYDVDPERIGISLGPVAVSYDVLDIAEEVFGDEITKKGVYFDFDPYFLMALAMPDDAAKWQKAVSADKKLAALAGPEGMVPDFFEKVQAIKRLFRERHGRDLNLNTLDLGNSVYWADIGQHSAMREKFMALNDRGELGIVARAIAGITGIRDANGNILVNSTISPGVTVKNSVLVNATVTGEGQISDSVILDSELADVDITKAFAVRSVRLAKTTLGENCGLYESLGVEDLELEPVTEEKDGQTVVHGTRHVSVLTSRGRVDARVAENTNLRDKANTFDVPIMGNEMSFAELRDAMDGVSMAELEARRRAQLEEINRIKERLDADDPLRFGTSGLRDRADKLTDEKAYLNTRGFIKFLKETREAGPGTVIAVGGDLRASTPRLLMAVIRAIEDEGCVPDLLGEVPSPVVAYYAMQKGIPSVMITGSHIPDVTPDNPSGRNGIKFTKKSGEVLKDDEKPILRNVYKARVEEFAKRPEESVFDRDGSFKETRTLPAADNRDAAIDMYVRRYTEVFGNDALAGLRIVVYQQSAVGRELIPAILEALGAEVLRVGWSDDFIPVDTEKISKQTQDVFDQAVTDHAPDLIITFDGDTDRPLLADETGKILPGDKLGALVSMFLNPDFAAVPVSANPAVIKGLTDAGIQVKQTKIGSPYVIKAMNDKLGENPSARVVSWESNGGFLTGSDWTINGNVLKALPTRDAALPLISAALLAKREGKKMSRVIAEKLPPFSTAAQVVDVSYPGMENYTTDMGKDIVAMFSPSDESVEAVTFDTQGQAFAEGAPITPELERELQDIRARLVKYFSPERGFGDLAWINFLDGIRMMFVTADGKEEYYHIRPSGNAPEFRNYTAAEDEPRAVELVELRSQIMPAIVADMTGTAAPVQAIRTRPAAETPESNIVNAILEGKPVYLTPYKQPKVWGVDGIGEYWYGAEAGEKSSRAKVGGNEAAMADVMEYAPEEVLGPQVQAVFGRKALPLVKILTPKGRLSAQFHDTKNELWIVTGIDKARAGETPSIILGFSESAVKQYGENVAAEYGRALEKYGTSLNKLIDVLEKQGFTETLRELGNAEEAAARVASDNSHVTAALLDYDVQKTILNSFYNYRPVKEGDVIPIPARTLHALGPGIEVVEPQIPGPTQSLEDGATYPVRYYFPGYKRPGAEKKLDIDRVGEMNPDVVQETPPRVIASADNYSIERLPGAFEEKGLEVHRINMEAGAEIPVTEVNSFHNLFLLEGKARIILDGEAPVEYDIPKASREAEMLVIPATAKSYRIVADENSRIVDGFTSVPALSPVNVTNGDRVPGTEAYVSEENVVYAEFPTTTTTFDQLYILDKVPALPILEGRRHDLIVQRGRARLEKADGTPIADLEAGDKYTLPEGYDDYVIVKTGEENAVVKVDYEKTEAEKAVYATYEMVKKYMEKIEAEQIDLILPAEMFVPGGKSTVGSALWEQEQLRRYVSDKIRISTYSAKMGLKGAAKKSLRKGAVGILVATESNIENVEEAVKEDPEVKKFLFGDKGTLRTLAIPDIDKVEKLEDKGWYFNREVEGTALLLAAVNPEDIGELVRNEFVDNAAADLKKLMTQLTGNSIESRYLYYLMGHKEIGAALDLLPAPLQDDPFGWLRFIVQKLLLNMPIKPFDATEQLHQRRKIMWSV